MRFRRTILALAAFAVVSLARADSGQLALWHEDTPQEVRSLGEYESMALKIVNHRGNSAVCGSGGLIDAAGDCGLVLSCGHLFPYVGLIEVVAPDGRRFEGTLVDVDRDVDLSLIAISTDSDMKLSPLAEETPLRGAEIVTAGYGWGQLREMRAKVTGWNQSGRRWDMHGSRGLRSGDSGSLVWNDKGEVVGIGWGTSGSSAYIVGLPTIYEFIERPKVVQYCGLFKNRPRRGKGCGPFGCKPRERDPESQPTPPRRPGAKPKPDPDRKAPVPDKPSAPIPPIVGPAGPTGPAGPPGPPGAPGRNADLDLNPLLAKLAALDGKVTALESKLSNTGRTDFDPKPLLAKLDGLDGRLAALEKQPAPSLPAPPLAEITHYVLAAKKKDSGWPRLEGFVADAKKQFPSIVDVDWETIPDKYKRLWDSPALVAYDGKGAAVKAFQGTGNVERALAALARSEP